MNKKQISFFTEQGFEIDGNGAYKVVRDYQVAACSKWTGYGTLIVFKMFSNLANSQQEALKEYLKTNKKELKISSWEVDAFGVQICMGNFLNVKAIHAVDRITEEMVRLEAKTKEYCPITGEIAENQKRINFQGFPLSINEASAQAIEEEIRRAEEEYQNSPNNYAKGIVGAIAGGAIGAVVWVVVGALLGLVSGWIAFLIAFLAGKGYDKMKGKANYTKIIVSSVVTLAYVVISMFLIYVLIVKSTMSEYGIEGSAVSLLFQILGEDAEVRSEFLLDLVLGLVFGVIGVGFSIVQMRGTLHKKPQGLN